MIKLVPIPFNEDIYKKRIKKADGTPKKDREELHEHYNDIIQQVEHYTILERLNPLSNTIADFAECEDQLHDFYDSNSYGFGELKKEIKKLTIDNPLTKKGLKCPYCGINRHELHDLDHFIPRSKYGEFSILSENLIYSCTVCNQDYKGTKFLTGQDKRIFLHPYFDDALENTQILECQITVDDIYLKIDFKIREGLREENLYIYDIANTHLTELGLNSRYQRLIRDDLLDGFFNVFRDIAYTDKRRIKQLTIPECIQYIDQELAKLYGTHPNDFELLFWKSLKQCTNWFSNISGKEL